MRDEMKWKMYHKGWIVCFFAYLNFCICQQCFARGASQSKSIFLQMRRRISTIWTLHPCHSVGQWQSRTRLASRLASLMQMMRRTLTIWCVGSIVHLIFAFLNFSFFAKVFCKGYIFVQNYIIANDEKDINNMDDCHVWARGL